MKKFISVVLSVILVISVMPLQVLASNMSDGIDTSNIIKCMEYELRKDSGSQAVITKARDDLENLESVGFTEDSLGFSQVTDQGEILYSFELPNDTFDLISVSEDDYGNLTLNIYEGDIHDVLTYASDGSMYVNGSKIEFSKEDAVVENAENLQDSGSIYANSRTILHSLSPFVDQNTYTQYKGQISYSKASWGAVILQNAAVATIAGVIASAIAAALDVSALPVALVTNVALAMQSEAKIYGMKDAYYSFKFSKYQSTASPILQYDYKYTGACYSQRNYEGTRFGHIFYESNIFT